ncbi:MAG: tetratricopeptide repeat protein [Wenzhouxiangellaceae bacterium]
MDFYGFARLFVVFTLVALVALSTTESSADESGQWLEVSTEHFLVRTNTSRDKALELATDLEKYRFLISYLSGVQTQDVPSPPLIVYAFDTLAEYHERTGARGTLGFYVSRPEGPLSVLSLEDGEEDWQSSGKQVLFHEYTHHILHQFSPIQYPRWYDEGFAEYLSMVEFDGDDAIIGKAALHRAPSLKNQRSWLRAHEIVDSKGRYIGHIGTNVMRDPRRGRTGTRMQYAQGWLMVHYLHSRPELQRGIGPWLMAVNRADVDDEKAFEQAFGMNLRQFDREVRRYWDDARLAMGRVEIGSKLPPIEPEVREIPGAEADALRYEPIILANGASQVPASLARKAFEQCIDEGIRVNDMRLSLIKLALADKDWEESQRQIDQLLATDPDNAPGLTASIELQRRKKDDKLDAETALALREQARQVILKNPAHVPALMQYADLTFKHELELDRNINSVVESIRFLAPGLTEGQVFEARLFARKGATEEARAILDELIKWSRSSDQAIRLQEIRRELIG